MSQFAYLEREDADGEPGNEPRKRLRLSPHDMNAPGDQAQLIVHEISDSGLLLESTLPLVEGEQLDVVMPHEGARRVTIVWACGRYFGCRFAGAGTASAVKPSAAPAGMDALPKKGSEEAVALAQVQLHELSMAIERITGVIDRAINQLSKREP